MIGRLIVVTIGLCAAPALAQDPPQPEGHGFEAGIRWWVSTGSTQRSHDASSFAPGQVGNPTSTLAYTNLDANVGELFARKGFGEVWFVKGNLGLGRINTGSFTDQDFFFLAGQPAMTQTVSATDGKLGYATIDVGREFWHRGETRFSLFAGLQSWNERVDGHGFSDSFGPSGLPPDVHVIRNDLTWQSLRLGGEMRAVRGRTRFIVEAAAVPYAKYRNEDSHFLRQDPGDLGPVPNVIATGHGWGGQLDAEVRRSFPQWGGVELGLGYRYWYLESTKGSQSQAGLSFPIVDLWSKRHGFTLTLGKSW